MTGDTGDTGERGDRGDSGDRGVAGERGMRGDHGQDGEPGPRGAQGVSGKVPGALAVGLVALLLTLVVLTFVQVQRLSGFTDMLRTAQVAQCEVNNATRQAIFNNTKMDAQARERVTAGGGLSPGATRNLIELSEAGQRDLERLIEAAAPIAERRGSVTQDCAAIP